MSRRSMEVASLVFACVWLGHWASAQGRPAREQEAPVENASSSVSVVFDGIVLEPDGAPAVGTEVVTSAGGRAVTGLDGGYRLEVRVPLEAEGIQVTAVSGGGGGSRMASKNVGLLAVPGLARIDPLVLALGASCQTRWLPTFGSQPGANDAIKTLAVFDDGSGPALYAGGEFTAAGGVSASYVARWDGANWSALGSGMSHRVETLTVFDDGSGPALYAGGLFTSAGGVARRSTQEVSSRSRAAWPRTRSRLNPPLVAGGACMHARISPSTGTAKEYTLENSKVSKKTRLPSGVSSQSCRNSVPAGRV